MISKYQPKTVKARSWNEIEEHYIDLNKNGWGHDRLLELVRHIKETGLSQKLFATTSVDKLVVSIYDQIEWHKEALHIEFDRQEQHWVYRYFSRPFDKPEFERRYDAVLGLEKFDKFVSNVGW